MKKPLVPFLLTILWPFFAFSQNNPCSSGKVIISEIYSDPTPSNGLPEFEFIELFNTCNDTVHLHNWKITDGSSTGTITGEKLAPGEYLILCQAKVVDLFLSYGRACGLASWPILNNLSDSITLIDEKGEIIDVLNYDLNYFSDKEKVNGGWSIEVVDPYLFCRGLENWRFSKCTEGGTPGTQNSVFQRTPDLIKPTVHSLYTTSSNHLMLVFSESMKQESIVKISFAIEDNEVIDVTVFASEKNKALLTLEKTLAAGQFYDLTIQSISDCNNNEIEHVSIRFEYDVKPPELHDLLFDSFYSITCIFNEDIDKLSAEKFEHYLLNGSTPQRAVWEGKDRVTITFNNRFAIDQLYFLQIIGLQDNSGNAIQDTVKTEFTFTTQIDSIVVHDPYLVSLSLKIEPNKSSILKENITIDPIGCPSAITFSAEDPKRILIHLNNPLKANSWFKVHLKSVHDLQGHLLQTPSQEFFYDTRAPQLLTSRVLDSKRIEIVFDEKIDIKTAIAIHNFETDHENLFPQEVKVVNDSTLMLEFANPFHVEKIYNLSINNIQDLFGNRLSRKIHVAFVFDNQPPKLVSVLPYKGNKLQLRFSEAPSDECLVPTSFSLNQDVGNPSSVVSAGWDSTLVWLIFVQDLKESDQFELQVSNLSDKRGNKIDWAITESFSTIFPKIADVELVSYNEIKVICSEEINLLIGLQQNNWMLNQKDKPILVTALSKKEIIIKFSEHFQPNSINVLNASLIEDSHGNISENETFTFEYNKKISSSIAVDQNIIKITFKEILNESSIENIQLTISPDIGNNYVVTREPNNLNTIKIVLGQAIEENIVYELEIQGLLDVYERTLPKEKTVILLDRTPPAFLNVKTLLPQIIEVIYSEPMDRKTAENKILYLFVGFGNPTKAVIRGENQDKVALEFNFKLTKGETYKIKASGIADVAGNQMINEEISFCYLPPHEPMINDLLITEIMANPGNNEHFKSEYLELFNSSKDTINLSGIVLADKIRSTLLGEYFLAPKEYVAVVPTKEVINFISYGPVIGVTNWPTLNDQEDELILTNRNGALIFSIAYQDTWYRDSSKKKGFSLEMIDTSNPCSGYYNWTSSIDPKGGTPGRINSVKEDNPDLTAPTLVKAIAPNPNTIVLFFNEKINPTSIIDYPWSYDPPIEIETAMVDRLNWSILKKNTQSPLNEEIFYRASINSVKDCAGNILNPQTTGFLICRPAKKSDVFFNEILFDPRSGGVEFIELYNKTTYPIDLKNWTLIVSDKAVVISSDHLVIEPGDYMVLTKDPSLLKADYPKGNEEKFIKMKDMQALANTEGIVTLIDSMGMTIDSLYYSERMHLSLLKNKKGVSLERISTEWATTDVNNWKSASSTASFATPGLMNSQMKSDQSIKGNFMVSPVSFSPDDPYGRNHTFIHYELDAPGYIASITIFDRAGRLVKVISKNESLGSSGAFRWDGVDSTGKRVSMGYYIILIEAFDLEGRVVKVREKVAVAN